MIVTAGRLRSMGWIAVLVVCAALVMVLAFRVNALRSQVHQSQARIVALKQETMYLETEFETRANQQQLKAWNDVEFGFVAPASTQYLDNERQLASYAKPIEPGAPAPVRVASADDTAAPYPAMVSPLTGKAMGEAADHAKVTRASVSDDSDDAPVAKRSAKLVPAVATVTLAGLGDRLSTVRHASHDKPAHDKTAKDKPAHDKSARDKATAHAAGKDAKTHDTTVRTAKAGETKPKAHLASADDAHHRAPAGKASGSAPIRLALKDAKAIK
ncbi:hypothetical protein [Novosphingobium acidiphilum]|uniref:hypothetical protein n=1 Tax=Novosphingobium acidiphilum TaxID=505248 RepID=UPI0004223E9C|nr:hypothetical protein [Novosphingobium acidiphilum]